MKGVMYLKKAALYIRVSTSHQIDKDSLPFQRQELSNYSKYVLGIDDFEIFEDAGYSAKNTDRPKYQEMMSRIKNNEFSHLLVWKIDRISRNLKDFTEMYDELKDYGVTFISKNEQFDTSSAMGEAMLKIILVFAELERKLTAERVFSIMLSRAEKGLWNGATVPLGYKWSKEKKFPVIDEEEARTVKYIYDLYEKKASTSKVAFQLNSEQVKTKRGGKWTSKTVNDILRNPFYIGTYRYNVKNSPNRRWKDEKEWVVVENNHPGFVSKEQFEKVNKMLSDNYKGNGEFQRANTNTHIFSKILFCGKCGLGMNAGLDRARKDGYRPSRYTCYSNHFTENTRNCNNFVSDITLMPFVLNYISNFINLQNKITQKHSLRDIERILLRGKSFVDVECIDRKGLEETYIAFAVGFDDKAYNNSNEEESAENLELESLKKEKLKYEKALKRLEDLFLFSDEAMSNKDFLFKKRDLTQHLERVNEKLSELHRRNADMRLTTDVAFLNKASNFLMSKHLSGKRNIDYRELLAVVDKTLIQDFIQTVIDKIIVIDKRVHSITFQNGITHNFLYKAKEKQKMRPKQKFLYRSYEPILIQYLKEHESVSRKEVEDLIGMGRTGAGSILKEFVDRGIVEKKGNSVATRYFLKEKKTT
ncbi:Site-specific DNA recombinase [Tepidibacter formicigenes DSM 15518]|jgi:DNA invertase Pin-like site-specific DNA recombinase|uniref:Site-specific DNA recombinase n=1 Tax=Tepidibacter formicigenes DSM 15518 TaxID=1123349 RepID=A0A1M6LVY1_9FIRM|nr:Site-specific DNA recombinase [Tepidibacter formicigenes DSM 15518]